MTRETIEYQKPIYREVTTVTSENASWLKLPLDQRDEIIPGCRTWTMYDEGRPIGSVTVWPNGRAAMAWGGDSIWGDWDGLFVADSGDTYNGNGKEVSGGQLECTSCEQVIARGNIIRRCDADNKIYCASCLSDREEKTWAIYEDGRRIGTLAVSPDGRAVASAMTRDTELPEVSDGEVTCCRCHQTIRRGETMEYINPNHDDDPESVEPYCLACATAYHDDLML